MNAWSSVGLILAAAILGAEAEESPDSAGRAQEESDSGQEPRGSVRLVRLECSHRRAHPSWNAKRRGWELALDADGRAKLTIRRGAPNPSCWKPGDTERSFSVEKGKISAIEAAISKYRFFDLPAEIGDDVLESNIRVLRIWTTKGRKSVTIREFSWQISFDDYCVRVQSFDDDTRRENARRAIRLWKIVRGCFDDEEAIDARPGDRGLLQLMDSPRRLPEDKIKKLKELLHMSNRRAEPSGER